MLRMMFIIIALAVIIGPTWALTETRLLGQSTSGQTVLFNLGTHDGIAPGDFAVVVKAIRDVESRDLKFIPAAKARNVKMNSDSSVWILFKIYDPELFIKGEKFILLTETNMLRGRRAPVLGRSTVVVNPKEAKSQIKDNINSDKDRLSKLKNNYEEIAPTHSEVPKSDTDLELVDVESWKDTQDAKYRSALYKGPAKAEFQRQVKLSTFEKMVTTYLEKVNDPDFNYDKFYEEQRKSSFAHEFREKTNFDSEYNKFLSAQAQKNTADAKLFRSILEKGQSWSEDYSDEELRRVLNEVSILQEVDRRDWVMAKPSRYAVALDYGFFLTDDQGETDTKYKRDNRYSTQVDFELVPFLRHPELEKFTINTTFRLNHTAFEAETVNANLDEYSLTLGGNWYPWHAPYAVEAPVLLVGMYVRSGFGSAESPTANQTANYTIFSAPGFRAGFKYLLKNRWGIRMLFNLETLKLERYEASKQQSIFPESTNLVEGKVDVGVTYAF